MEKFSSRRTKHDILNYWRKRQLKKEREIFHEKTDLHCIYRGHHRDGPHGGGLCAQARIFTAANGINPGNKKRRIA
jgi:hypothetical protein